MARPDADVHGVLVVDKPVGVTSHDVVARTRREFGTRRVGHAGTLDPDASGVLVLGLGKATRLLTYLVADDKEYEAIIRLGASTTTDDAAGDLLASASTADLAAIGDADIGAAVAALTGDLMQRPSAVSAIKVDGQRAYARVRSGEEVMLAARPVTVSEFEIRGIRHGDSPAAIDLDARLRVSSGTYIRALARDLGEALGVGGHVISLRRTRSGRFTIADAQRGVVPLGEAMAGAMPTVEVGADDVANVRFGRRISALGIDADTDVIGVVDEAGDAIAIARAIEGALAPIVVFT